MAKRIIDTSTTCRRIVDTSPKPPRIDPGVVAAALGGEPVAQLEPGGSPLSVLLTRAEMARRFRTARNGVLAQSATATVELVLTEGDLQRLQQLAATLAENGVAPSAGQVASVLVKMSLQYLGKNDVPSVKSALQEPNPKSTAP